MDIRDFARKGAEARLRELDTERDNILTAFPDLRNDATAPRTTKTAPRKGGRRKPMTAAEKKAVSARMKKYWAERRKAKS